MSDSHCSEVARLRERIELEEQAAELGLYGLAEVARHERIIARMEQGGKRILGLIQAGRHEEALVLMNSENWGVEESEDDRQP